MGKQKRQTIWKDFSELISFTNPPKRIIFLAIFAELISTIFTLLLPIFAKNSINAFQNNMFDLKQLVPIGLAFIFSAFLSGWSIYLLNLIGQKIILTIRETLFSRLIRLPMRRYDENSIGDFSSRVVNDAQLLKGVLSDHLINFLSGLIKIIGATIGLFVIDVRLTSLLIFLACLLILIVIPFTKKIYELSRATQDNLGTMTTNVHQALSEIKLVKSSNAEQLEEKKNGKIFKRLYNLGIREGTLQSIMSPAMSLITLLIAVVVLGYGSIRVISGTLSMGSVTGFALYMFQLFPPLTQLVYVFGQLQRARAASDRTIHIFTDDPEKKDGSSIIPWNCEINFSDISFSYNKHHKVINQVNFTIPAKSITAFVGPSGSGKSTIFSLIERFYQPTCGYITIDEKKIDGFSLESWRKDIGYVSQDVSIINGTVLENICYGIEYDVPEDVLDEAIKMSGVNLFECELPDGLETEVGERGLRLSGGQRQRISIARAILKKPKLLLLDEATSNLDSIIESSIIGNLRKFMRERTTVIIAHRLSTVIHADKILFLDNGEITGSGTHNELLRSHLKYKIFAEKQLVDELLIEK